MRGVLECIDSGCREPTCIEKESDLSQGGRKEIQLLALGKGHDRLTMRVSSWVQLRTSFQCLRRPRTNTHKNMVGSPRFWLGQVYTGEVQEAKPRVALPKGRGSNGASNRGRYKLFCKICAGNPTGSLMEELPKRGPFCTDRSLPP